MGTFIDITGQQFNNWTVLRRSDHNNAQKKPKWDCVCICGTTRSVAGALLKNGLSKSCGCVRANKTHGLSRDSNGKMRKEYTIWSAMVHRCTFDNDKQYKYYGGRGIIVCDRWLYSFPDFLLDMGECNDGLTLERRDTNGNYEPNNCYWASWNVQFRNTRHNVWVKYGNECNIKIDWIRKLGITPASWHYWIKKGLTNEVILEYFINKKTMEMSKGVF